MKRPAFKILLMLLIIAGCNNANTKNDAVESRPDITALKMELIAADKEFSALSDETGMKNAFIETLDSNGVLLRKDNLPIIGANAIDYLVQQNDREYKITWDPRRAEVAASGDLGYTYGIYALRPVDKDTTIYGTYVSIWRRQADGRWKLMLDSGNEGIGDGQTLQD